MTIVNIPEQTESDIEVLPKKTLEESRDTTKNTQSSPTTAQNILNEMFCTLAPQKRNAGTGLDTNSLAVKARSISPEPRQAHVPILKPVSRDLKPAPSPTPANSRPASARYSNKENIPPANFSVKHFAHFCFDDNVCTTIFLFCTNKGIID